MNPYIIESGVLVKNAEGSIGNASASGSRGEKDEGTQIVSPEFAEELSHSHNESANDDQSSEAFDQYITQSFTELNGFLPEQEEESILFSSTLPTE